MEFQVPRYGIHLIIILRLTSMIAMTTLESEERIHEVTTEGFEFPTYDTNENVTESPRDNGMTIGDISREVKTVTFPTALEGKEEVPSPLEQKPVLVSFPDNHRNFTPSQYLGDQDFPPYYNHLSTYQQQYKNYYEQKQMYNRNPIKFEKNSMKNLYLAQKPNSLDFRGDEQSEKPQGNSNPFPYAFENEKTRANWYATPVHESDRHEESHKENEKAPEAWYKTPAPFPPREQSYKETEAWYKPSGHLALEENPNAYALRGHQETGLPHFVFPYTHLNEDKFYENEMVHYDRNHLKKDEKPKESPWKNVFHVLSALVPLGLLLATLTPNVIAINSTASASPKASRQRSEDARPLRFEEEELLKLMKKYGVESLSEAQCEDRIICELAKEGVKTSAEPIERGFWYLANQTPWDVAEKAGMNDLFKHIKSGNCDKYKCPSRTGSFGNISSGKKLIKMHKITK